MSYYPELDSHIRDKVKVVLDLSNYATKKQLDDAVADRPNLAAKSEFITLKADVNKLEISKLVNVRTGLNNLKVK